MLEQWKQFITAAIIGDPDYDLDPDEPLISSGLIDSFSLMDIALHSEEAFGIVIEDSDLNADSFDTLNELVAFVESRR